MLIPDYVAIGTLVILTLVAMGPVYTKKKDVSLPGRAVGTRDSRSFDKLKDPDRPRSFNQRVGGAQ